MTYEIEKLKGTKDPVFHVELLYMLGDADGRHNEDIPFSPEEFEKILPYLEILMRLLDAGKKRRGGYSHAECFGDFSNEYPGPECGLTEEQYDVFIQLRDQNLSDDNPMEAWVIAESMISETSYNYAFLERIEVHYYDEEGRKHNVNFKY